MPTAMLAVLLLLASYALTFSLQNKVTLLHLLVLDEATGWRGVLYQLLDCSFCLGFWTGWVTWGASWLIQDGPIICAPTQVGVVTGGLVWALASSTFCYVVHSAFSGK